MRWKVYLSGEIHTAWRAEIEAACEQRSLPIDFYAPVTDHGASDDVGEVILGKEESGFWKDHKAAKINAIRGHVQLAACDIVVVRFGEQYKQWNAAFDAGYAAALGKPLIVQHDPKLTHPLKEVDAAALAVVQTTDQIVEIFQYVIQQR